jgi:hypothetical protein
MPAVVRDQLRVLAVRSPSPIELKQMVRLEDRYALRIEHL